MSKYKFLSHKLELLITILLLIIAWVMLYSYFLSWEQNNRDAVRTSDLIKINDELNIYYVNYNMYPLPDDIVNITASWEIITYQWYAWENLFGNLWIDEIKDPKEDNLNKYLNYYTYATNYDRQKIQLMAFSELNKKDINNKYFINERTPLNFWEKVWIAIEDKTKRPIQETRLWFDIFNTIQEYIIYIDNELIVNKDNMLNFLNYTYLVKTNKSQAKSCLEIKNAWWNENWYYWIYDENTLREPIKVYCEMESDWWGRTRLYYKDTKETCKNDDNIFNEQILQNLLTKDFAVSDKIETLNSEWSWVLNNINFNYENFDFNKMTNVANCKTPEGSEWSIEYWSQYQFYHKWENWELIRRLDDSSWFLKINWLLSTFWTWEQMFYGCKKYKNINEMTEFSIWWMEAHTGWFIHSSCNNYSSKDNSITSRWDWDNTRVIWVR